MKINRKKNKWVEAEIKACQARADDITLHKSVRDMWQYRVYFLTRTQLYEPIVDFNKLFKRKKVE